jgi:Zn-dependent peptidase ImmA (M78 family)
MSLKVPFLSDADIKNAAAKFAAEYDSQSSFIFPIEQIIEFKLEMNIISVPGLRKNFDIDAWTTGDFTEIVIDRELADFFENRYRFSLSHEIGHFVLHRNIFKEIDFNSIDDWINFYKGVDLNEYDKLETQGNKFANFLLLPAEKLKVKFEEAISTVSSLIEDAKRNGLARHLYLDYALDRIASEISKTFLISKEATQYRLRNENELIKMIK